MPVTCPRCLSTYHDRVAFCGLCGAAMPAGTGTTEAFPDPLVGQVLSDRYRILALIGRGGMGAVYRAEHVAIGKPVAIKILHGTLGQRKEVLHRFRREAEAASKLTHIHTVQVFDYGHWRGLTYLVMEYLRGQDLASVIRKEGLIPWARAVAIIVQVCDSLSEAHAAGIVHRDLKPENVLLVPRAGHPDFVKVVDFGLAKIRDEKGALETTGDGSLLGTPFYMSPEQIRGEAVDARTDVYAIGGILYRSLTGLPPFEAPTPFAVLTKHLSDALVPPSIRAPDAGIPAALDELVGRAMAKGPQARFRSAEEMRRSLSEAVAAITGSAPTPSLVPQVVVPPVPAPAPPPPAAGASSGAAVSLSLEGLDLSRDEFARYVRRLRFRRLLRTVLLLFLVGGAAVGALVVPPLLREPPGPRTVEAEPNNAPTLATRIALGTTVTGTIGRRQSPTDADADYFRVEIRPLRKGVLRVDASGIPGLDLRLDVFDVSGGEPLATGDRGGPGAGEAIAGLLADGMVYFVRVSERVPSGGVPSERISDNYRLTVTLRSADEFEGEPNDDPATALALAPGAAMSGHLEVETDRDMYCLLSRPAAPPRAVVTPPPGLDVAVEAGGALVNAAGTAAPESVPFGAAAPCIVVRVAPDAEAEGKAAVGADAAYRIEVR